MGKRCLLVGIFLMIGGCSKFSDSEIIVRTSPEKRPPKPDYMPPDEKPISPPAQEGKGIPPISPQVGIRVPLEQ
jgi:hypothetical protein